ncbi:MAG: GAF domain-containing protein [Thermoflexales bacterium]|nr:GAF domain-containing protein [Thermoflexales bacterium]
MLSGGEGVGRIGPEVPLMGAHVRNIRAQLLGNALIVLTVILWTAFLIGSAMVRVNRALVQVGEETQRANAALLASRVASDLFTAIGQGTLAEDPQLFVESVATARERLKEAQDRLLASAAPLPSQDPLWAELARLRASVAQVDNWTTYLIEQAKSNRWAHLRELQVHLVAYYQDEIAEAAAQTERLTGERLARANEEAAAAREMLRNVSIAWGIVLFLVVLGVNAALFRSIADPLERLTGATAQLAAGRLETRVAIGRADEFGRLAQAFNEMADRLQTLYNELEDRVQERTRALQEANYALQRRAIQLEASAEVSRAITSIFNIDELLRQAVNLIRDRFGFYHAGIFLIDETGEWAVLREATGEAGAQMKAQGHRLRVAETSMVGWTALHRKPRIALDVGKDAVRFANPLLPHTRSEMTLPLMVGDRLLGVLNVQSAEEAAFDEDDIRALQSMADQLAIAIENARRLSEEAMLLEATSPVYRFSRRLSTATTAKDVADVIIEAISETEADGCFVVEFESSDGVPEALDILGAWRRERTPAFRAGMRLRTAEAPLPVTVLQRLWISENAQQDAEVPPPTRELFRATNVGALVNIPLRVGERVVGEVLVVRSSPGPFSPAALRLYEVISDQAAVALERARLLENMRQRAEQEEALRSIADQITATFDLRTALQTTLQQLGRVLDARGGYAELGVR